MIERRTPPQSDVYSTSPAFSGLYTEFDRAMPWAQDAACRDEDPDLFFPVPLTGKGSVRAMHVRLAKAKAVCGRCPVRRECLEHALELPEDYGIWGGLTEEERQATRKSPQKRRFATA